MSTVLCSAQPAAPAPSAEPEDRRPRGRIVGLDVARALAVFGMFGAHVGVVADDVRPSPATWSGVVNGRPSILFAVLAGVSVALLSGRTVPLEGDELVRARTRILVRAAWVFAIGGALEALGTEIAVILGVYALLFVFALPFLRWGPRRLLRTAAVLAVVTPPLDLALARVVEANDAGDAPLVSLAVTGAYPALIWSTFVLVGLGIGRCDLTAARVRTRLLAVGAGLAVAGYGGGWLSTQWWTQGRPIDGEGFSQRPTAWDPAWLTGALPHSGTTFEIVGSVGVALVVIGVCLALAERLPALVSPFAAVGAMALTVYTAQVVAVRAAGTLEYTDNSAWLLYILAGLAVASVWRPVLGRGPLERLLTCSSTRAVGQAVPGPAPRSRERVHA